MQKSVISAISERESGDGSAGIFQGFKVEIRIFSSILQPVLKFFDRRSAFLGLGCALLLSGCGSVMQAQQEAMDHYRAIILEEAQLDNSTREQLYQQGVVSGEDLAKAREGRKNRWERCFTFARSLCLADARFCRVFRIC